MTRFIFSVPDMSCEHCRNTISNALEAAALKEFDISLDSKTVTVESDDAEAVRGLIEGAGYSAVFGVGGDDTFIQ
jgi:copper chaperone